MSDKYIVYHNPRCSKSRMAVEYLTNEGKSIEIVEYLKEIPSKKELTDILIKLNIPAEKLIRKGESDYKANFKGKDLSDAQWIDAMIQFPKLIERPIVIKEGKAVIARPTERIVDLD